MEVNLANSNTNKNDLYHNLNEANMIFVISILSALG
jgi:hypothetical protein